MRLKLLKDKKPISTLPFKLAASPSIILQAFVYVFVFIISVTPGMRVIGNKGEEQ